MIGTPQNPSREEKDRADRFEAMNDEDGLVHEDDGKLIDPQTGKVVEADLEGSLWEVGTGLKVRHGGVCPINSQCAKVRDAGPYTNIGQRHGPNNAMQTRSKDAYDHDSNTASPYDAMEKHATFDFGVPKGQHGHVNPDEWEEQHH